MYLVQRSLAMEVTHTRIPGNEKKPNGLWLIYSAGQSPPTLAVLLHQPSLPLPGPLGLPRLFPVLPEPSPFIFPTCVFQVLLGTLAVGAQESMVRKGPWWLIERWPILAESI